MKIFSSFAQIKSTLNVRSKYQKLFAKIDFMAYVIKHMQQNILILSDVLKELLIDELEIPLHILPLNLV